MVGAVVAWHAGEGRLQDAAQTRGAETGVPDSAIGASFFLSNLAGKLFNCLPNNSFPGTTGGDTTNFNLDHRLIDTTYLRSACWS